MWRRGHLGQGEIPCLVAVETTNHCNATCTFCPCSALSRPRTHMSDELFEKIVEDCREFRLEAIEPFLQGEPFCDPKIMDRMERIRVRLPDTKLRLYSNGNALTPKKIDRLTELGIDHLYISVNTLDPETYRHVMGLKLERTLENLAYLTSPAVKGKVARRITFRMTRTESTPLEDQDRFLRYCRDRGVRPFIVGPFNYKGDIASELPIPGYPCEHVNRFTILSNGQVTLCCQDQDAEYALGDVNQRSVLEVYRGEAATHFRKMLRSGRRREYAPCQDCNLFWPGLAEMPLHTTIKYAAQAGYYFLTHRPTGRRRPKPAGAPINAGKLES